MPHIDLSDDEAAVLTRELTDITGNDRCSLSPRVQTLKAILAKLERPKPPAWWRFSRGTPYFNDQMKLIATFFNNLAVASFVSAVVLPVFKPERLPDAIAAFGVFIGLLCLCAAQYFLGRMK